MPSGSGDYQNEKNRFEAIVQAVPIGCVMFDRHLNTAGCKNEFVLRYGIENTQCFIDYFAGFPPAF